MKRSNRPAVRAVNLCAIFVAFAVIPLRAADSAVPKTKPLKALLVAGGCCHDYKGQHLALFKGIQARANVQVDVWWTDDKSVNPPLPLYENPDWAKGYDVIIHDECAAGNKDLKVMKNILDAHKTVPSVHLHCAMHSFRNGTDQWFKHLGIQSARHGPQKPIDVNYVDKKHPITAPLENWTTINEELYNNVNIFDAQALAMGTQKFDRKGEKIEDAAVVAWVNEKQGARSFSTTLGHNTATVEDGRYLELVTRGLLWACGKLNDDYLGKAFTGKNSITFHPKNDQPKPVAKPGKAPKGATLVTMTASSEETGKKNYIWHAVDGDKNTRWCAGGGSKPQWIQLEFKKPQTLTGAKIIWESTGCAYQHKIEGSVDGTNWAMLADQTGNQKKGDTECAFPAKAVRFVKITITGTSNGGNWASIREISLQGKGIKSLYPKLSEKQKVAADASKNDPYQKEGNIPPKIVELTPEEEADILKDVKVPEGFDVSIFSDWRAANYPVYVAAAPNGDLYVSSDGNGSLGRDPHRGRVLRLRDTDKDGRADEVTEFIKDIDSPRGLIWDHDRLYLLHPPHISVFFDIDGDGVAEKSKRLIDGIAFGFKDRPADHTTNGIDIGIDGWIYIAGGDFGFMKATGTDGRELQHRGGGVIRFRPDGSGLEIFATGTRNILGTAISPLLDIFARDNTNDGGGWDVRFHHFTGLEDHGYPRLYKNFPDEHIQPLADYGGGSGCGSVYIHEPGFPAEWANAPFTCDWGKGALFRHSVQRKGATFEEITDPQPFIKVTRPTDADVDGMSAVYQASWRGPATFGWKGPEQGYIVRVTPKGYTPEPLPDYEKLSDTELVAALDSPSRIRTMAAQRSLFRRGELSKTTNTLVQFMNDKTHSIEARVAALNVLGHYIRKNEGRCDEIVRLIAPLTEDADLSPFLMRMIGDIKPFRGTIGHTDILAIGLKSHDPRTRLEAITSVVRRHFIRFSDAIAESLGHDDPAIAHVAFRALAKLGAAGACLTVLDSEKQGQGAAFALMRMHDPAVVNALISRLAAEKNPIARKNIIAALCRLHHREGEWTGQSWGTRPDTRGPYYQLETWSESEKILTALKTVLASGDAGEVAFLVKEMNRNRIQSDDALRRVITMAATDESLIPDAVAQIAVSENMPEGGISLVLKAARNEDSKAATLAAAVQVLAKSDDKEAISAMLTALVSLDKLRKGSGKEYDAGKIAFLNAPKLENHHLILETIAAGELESPKGRWANMAVLGLASRKSGSPESREMSAKAIDLAWKNPQHKILLMNVAAGAKNHFLDDRIRIAMNDPLPKVAETAKKVAGRLKIQPKGADKTPKLSTLDPKQALAEVLKQKGDTTLGESIFARATCNACHTTSQNEPQKGPYLGNIFETYKRPEIAEAILDPNKTIAQGFATNIITPKKGNPVMGFVTDEQGDQVTIRDIASQEHTFKKTDIAKRDTLPTSIMPPGLMGNFTVHEFASLLDYLQAMTKKK